MNDGSMTINVPRVCGHTCAECVHYPSTLPVECFCAQRMRPVVKTQTACVYGRKRYARTDETARIDVRCEWEDE